MRSMTRPTTTLLLRVGLLDLVPDLHLLGFFAREDDVAVAIFGLLEQHVDDVAGLHGDLPVLVEELVDRDDAFGLEPDVDDHFGLGDLQHCSLDDLAFRDVAEAVIVEVQQAGIFRRIYLVVVEDGSDSRTGRRGTSLGLVVGRLARHQNCLCVLLFDVRHVIARPP